MPFQDRRPIPGTNGSTEGGSGYTGRAARLAHPSDPYYGRATHHSSHQENSGHRRHPSGTSPTQSWDAHSYGQYAFVSPTWESQMPEQTISSPTYGSHEARIYGMSAPPPQLMRGYDTSRRIHPGSIESVHPGLTHQMPTSPSGRFTPPTNSMFDVSMDYSTNPYAPEISSPSHSDSSSSHGNTNDHDEGFRSARPSNPSSLSTPPPTGYATSGPGPRSVQPRDWDQVLSGLQDRYGAAGGFASSHHAAIPAVPALVQPTHVLPLDNMVPQRQDIASQRVIAASEARRKNPPQWSCPICQQTFTTRTNCEDHMRAHSNQRPFKCDDCEKAFARKHELKRHQRTIHSTERPYQCDICGAGYARSDQRTRHMANCNGNPSTE